MSKYEYDVFISHSSKDRQRAEMITGFLQEHKFKVWLSYPEIEPAEEFPSELEVGITKSAILLVLWSKNAAGSKWVEREIIRADNQSKPIIPLMFDDTQLNLALTTTQGIDFRPENFGNSYTLLVSRLETLREVAIQENQIQTSGKPWEFNSRLVTRSKFLTSNNYIDKEAPNFGLNTWTENLVDYKGNPAKHFVTLVSTPFPNPIPNFDMDEFPQKINSPHHLRPAFIGKTNEKHWMFFGISGLSQTWDTSTNYLLYKGNLNSEKFLPYTYLRFDEEEGAIEYVPDINKIIRKFNPQENTYSIAYNFILILGACWKFINLSSYVYSHIGYEGNFQFLVNLRNTKETYLGSFAHDNNGRPHWKSPLTSENIAWDDMSNLYSLVSNIQLPYLIDTTAIIKSADLSQDIMEHISKRLQRAFNYPSVEPRHYLRNTNDFPWHQYYDYFR